MQSLRLSYFKTLLRFCFVATACITIERFCHLQTQGFRLYEILSDLPNDEQTLSLKQKEHPKEIETYLNQPFYFLGAGDQCYAFLGKDGKTVLKFFRHDHFAPKQLFKNLPFPSFLNKDKILNFRYLPPLFQSCKIAYEELKEQTGLLFLHLHKNPNTSRQVILYDRIGVKHVIDIEKTEFLLQKKADIFLPKLQKEIQQSNIAEGKRMIHELLNCIVERSLKGIGDKDKALFRNVGYIEGKAAFIDTGSFYKDPSLQEPKSLEKEILLKTHRLKRWLKKHHPGLYSYYVQEIQRFCPSNDSLGDK